MNTVEELLAPVREMLSAHRDMVEALTAEFARTVEHIHLTHTFSDIVPWTECTTLRCREAAALYLRAERLLDGGGS